MDGTILALFLFATFVGGVVAGLAGFAMSLVVSGIWLHIRLKLYGRFDDTGFRRIVLLLLLASGISLIVPASIFR